MATSPKRLNRILQHPAGGNTPSSCDSELYRNMGIQSRGHKPPNASSTRMTISEITPGIAAQVRSMTVEYRDHILQEMSIQSSCRARGEAKVTRRFCSFSAIFPSWLIPELYPGGPEKGAKHYIERIRICPTPL